MQTPHDDVIAAIATPIGEGSISVIRLSGTGAIAIADRNFRGRHRLSSVSSHTAHFGSFFDGDGNLLDQVVAIVFLGPHSYTGEDVVEISCHGGIYITKKVFEAVLSSGARPAEAGEFTQRAFLNGRIDLSQAEAVADLIRSRSDIAHRASVSQLQGKLSQTIIELRLSLLDLCGLIEIGLDFSEEGVELGPHQDFLAKLAAIIGKIEQLSSTFGGWRLTREGVRVALVGRPNVGKSSILNMLINEERAIVASIPGTTRDIIEEDISIGGFSFTIIDTAGLHRSSDFVEMEGMRRSEKEIQNSDLLLLVVEASAGILQEDMDIFERIKEISNKSSDVILVANKIDLGPSKLINFESQLCSIERVAVSAKTYKGLTELKLCLLKLALARMPIGNAEGTLTVVNARHKAALDRASQSLRIALSESKSGLGGEFIAPTLRVAIEDMGEIIGIVKSEDVLNGIFSKFCIGK